jgi:putative holliday junction resolvase
LGRIIALDYGTKRTGIAVTDPLQLIANGMKTINTIEIWDFLKEYFTKEKVDCLVIGYPVQMDGSASESLRVINPFIQKFRKTYPDIKVELVDERFTSKLAMQAMIAGGVKKKDRQNKALVDTVSAAIILQSFLDTKRNMK